MDKGVLYRIAGPVVVAKGIKPRMYDICRVGNESLMGEVIQIEGDKAVIQVYEDTSGIKPSEPVVNTQEPLKVELGPGMLGSIYDGIQRPLPVLIKQMGSFIKRGVDVPGLDYAKKWDFRAIVKNGEQVSPGQIIGEVEETGIMHKIMVPPNQKGKLTEIRSGKFTVNDVIGKLDNGFEIRLKHNWPVRIPRPFTSKLKPEVPLITGQRVFDALFPLAKGGVAAIPGPFGAGKTVSQQQLAKWSDADIIVYVGCGERGNEMTEVLTEFPELTDPRSNRPLMNRTVLIANTSNMPVAAREASIYTGVTIAEYFRDMGYSVALMADSTSRWAEAMREISSRLEEMPGEEGYPAYLSTRLAQFYERSGRVIPLGAKSTKIEDNENQRFSESQKNKSFSRDFRDTKNPKDFLVEEGSVSIIGAVSPPGGDFSEPVTQGTLRVTKVFWALDSKLSQRRHFPSINWLTSYSLYLNALEKWYSKNVAPDWNAVVGEIMSILQEEEKLLEIVQLVGSDALPERQQITLQVARLIREVLLQQNAFHEIDTYCDLKKTYLIMKSILNFSKLANAALDSGMGMQQILAAKAKDRLSEIKFVKDYGRLLDEITRQMERELKV